MNVIPYLRVSGKSQIDGDGFDRQLNTVMLFCAKHGLCYTNPVREEGVSGTVEAMDRPAFSELMREITEGRLVAGAIVVERLDRLARDLMVQEFLLKECRERGIKVFAADQDSLIDMASNDCDPTRVLIRQVLGALAQWEKAMLVAKLAGARARIKAETGRCEGCRPYGSMPGEASILCVILDMAERGMTTPEIANLLNTGGFKTRGGKDWSAASVYDILRKHREEIRRRRAEEIRRRRAEAQRFAEEEGVQD